MGKLKFQENIDCMLHAAFDEINNKGLGNIDFQNHIFRAFDNNFDDQEYLKYLLFAVCKYYQSEGKIDFNYIISLAESNGRNDEKLHQELLNWGKMLALAFKRENTLDKKNRQKEQNDFIEKLIPELAVNKKAKDGLEQKDYISDIFFEKNPKAKKIWKTPGAMERALQRYKAKKSNKLIKERTRKIPSIYTRNAAKYMYSKLNDWLNSDS